MDSKGYIYITSSGFDPELGMGLSDPHFGDPPTLGACMPNIREQVGTGDHIFVISGKVPQASQLVMGGFEVAEKLNSMVEAYWRFPSLRLHKDSDGHITGNIIVSPDGYQHSLDSHRPFNFERRIKNYVIGKNPIVLRSSEEMDLGRQETLPILREVLGKKGESPIKVVGRWSRLDKKQIIMIRDWLEDLRVRADAGIAA